MQQLFENKVMNLQGMSFLSSIFVAGSYLWLQYFLQSERVLNFLAIDL